MRLQPTLPSALVALAGCATDNSRTSQLCSVDNITIIQPGGRPDPRCQLGHHADRCNIGRATLEIRAKQAFRGRQIVRRQRLSRAQ